MKLPNKVTSIKSSIIPSLIVLIKIISVKPVDVISLYHSSSMNDISLFADALTCLFALNKIKLNDKGELELCY